MKESKLEKHITHAVGPGKSVLEGVNVRGSFPASSRSTGIALLTRFHALRPLSYLFFLVSG